MKKYKKIISLLLALLLICMPLSACSRRYDRPGETPDAPSAPDVSDTPAEKEGFGIYGADDVQITAGKFFNVMDGVSAKTESGEDISELISVSGEVNTSVSGKYTLTYSVEYNGESEEVERGITVLPNEAIGYEPPVYIYTADSSFNIAKGCAAYASNTTNGSAGQAVDGNAGSRWECEQPSGLTLDDEYLVDFTVDLGAVVGVESVRVDFEAAYATEFCLQISSDGKAYETVENVSGFSFIGARGDWNYDFGTVVNTRYIRLHLIKRATNYAYSIYEFEVYGKSGTVIPNEDYPVLYDAANSSRPDWENADEQWLLFDLGSAKQIDRVKVAFKNWLTPLNYEVLAGTSESSLTPVTLKNVPYSGDTFYIYQNASSNTPVSITARYVKIAMHSRMFYVPCYRITDVKFYNNETSVAVSGVTASSNSESHSAELSFDESDTTYWESEYTAAPQTVDLGEVKAVGRIDLYWKGDDGRKGKYYDLQISSDGETYATVYRQNHGATENQSIYLFEDARYIRIIDYQNTDPDRFMLEGITVHSQYPNESKVNYDTSLAFPEREVIDMHSGSYVTGGTDFPSAKLIAYLDDSLRDKPVPSNDWWQSLLINDKGHNMYLNPLTALFKSDGLWITNPGDGYFSGDNPGNGRQTIDVDVRDIRIGYYGMSGRTTVRVTGYSDYGISAVMTDDDRVDKLTAFLSQGALYAYCVFAEPEKATVWSDGLVGVYDLNGREILSNTDDMYTGDCIVVCVRTHSGYLNNVESSGVREYEERYYVVSVPANTDFVREESNIRVVMRSGNYMSVGAMSSVNTITQSQYNENFAHGNLNLTEAALMHLHGYAFIVGTTCKFDFDSQTNNVTTYYNVQTALMRQGYSADAVTAFMPHHYKLSQTECSKEYVYKTVRGDVRAYVGNTYQTVDKFYGVVPTFVEPTDNGYAAKELYEQLLMLYENNGGDKAPENSNLISGDPYWQGKNLHPMAIAALAADQIGATDLRDAFLQKIRYVLTDWFTYTPDNEPNDAYFYYDSEWGTLYYKNSEFGAGVNLADHHFTYGYYTLAAGVLSAFQPDFAAEFGDMIELIIRDYMNWERDDELFPFMRNYDVFAGHSWAGGYADNDGGNNQESAGEALNSWVGAYLYATAVGNEDIRRTAIYGFTTELNVIKQYWFNYDGDSFAEFYPYGTLGQLYGASSFFGTFFNGEPLYMYGIHLIPGEEFLTSYALNANEQAKLKAMIEKMRYEQSIWNTEEAHKTIYAWQHIFIPIVASYDPDEAIDWYNEVIAEQGNVGNTSEQFNVYYMIHALKSLGSRSTDIWAQNGASATVYFKDGKYTALCYNPTQKAVRYTFVNGSETVGSALIPACTLTTVDPTTQTDTIQSYTNCDDITAQDYISGSGVQTGADGVTFAMGSATYMLSCGNSEQYRRIKLIGNLTGAKLYIDGTEYPLTASDGGFVTDPLVLTFKHTFTVTASGGTLGAIGFESMELKQIDISGAVATASATNGANVAQNAIDGNTSTRWESPHNNGIDDGNNYDDAHIIIELPNAEVIYQMSVLWEAASAAEYIVYFSDDCENWSAVYYGSYSQGGNRTDVITPDTVMKAKYIKIEGIKRLTQYGYSIIEITFYNFGQ